MKNFIKNQFSLFLLSLVLAFILWLTVSGQDMSVHDLSAALELTGLPSNLALEDNLPETISLRIEANTAQFRFLEGRKYYFRYDLSAAEAGSQVIRVDWRTITPSLPRGIRVPRVIPEEITLNIYPYITVDLPIIPTITGQLPGYLELSGPVSIDPPTAKITGPAHRLEGLTSLPTAPIRLDDFTSPETTISVSPQASGLDTWLTVEPRYFRALAGLTLKTGQIDFSVPVNLDYDIWNDRPAPLELRPQEARAFVSWPLNHAAPSANDIKLSVRITAEDLRKTGILRLPIAASVPSWLTVTKIEPSHLTAAKLDITDMEP